MKRKPLAGFLVLMLLLGLLSGCKQENPSQTAESGQSPFQIPAVSMESETPQAPEPAAQALAEPEPEAPEIEAPEEPEVTVGSGFWQKPDTLPEEPTAQASQSPSEPVKPEADPVPTPAQEPEPVPDPTPVPAPEPEPAAETQGTAPVIELWEHTRYESGFASGTYISLLESNYQIAQLSAESAQHYPLLAATLDRYGTSKVQTMTQELDQYVQWAREELSRYAEDDQWSPEDFFSYFYNGELMVCRADSQAVSIYQYWSSYAGGVHPYYYYDCLNYDAQTGQPLPLSAVITDFDALSHVLEDLLAEKYGDIFFNLHEDLAAMDWESTAWVLMPDGIAFYFNPYDLSYFAAGAQTITLSPARYPDLFTSDYRNTPEEWALQIPLDEEFSYNYTSDGCDTVCVIPNYNPYDYIDSITVRWNGMQTTIPEVYCYNVTPMLMRSTDYGEYLYLDCLSDNDYHILFVVSPGGSGPWLVETLSTVGFGYRFDPDTYCTIQTAVTSPQSFYLTRRCQLLSSYTVTAEYHMGAQGIPVPYDPHFPIQLGFTLTTLQELTFPLVDETGQLTGQSVTLPVGSRLSFAYTDCETYVDLRLSDSRLCRVEVTKGAFNWPLYIQGYEATDCFDGMMFAG